MTQSRPTDHVPQSPRTPGPRTPTGRTLARWPREIAAAVTLRAACAALVAPDVPASGALDRRRAIAVTTACGALATRFAMVRFLSARGRPDPATVVSFDPFRDPTPPALTGTGPEPERDRLRAAGDRCAAAWRTWRSDGIPTTDGTIGAAGALALGAWCAWALGSGARATVRARHALDTWPDDPLAGLVLRSVEAGRAPTWAAARRGGPDRLRWEDHGG